MFSVADYFKDSSHQVYPEFNSSCCHDETIKEFYENFIYPHFKKMFEDNKSNFVTWCEIIEDYANLSLPIYWIRKFESGSGKAKVNDNRRTGTTVLMDDTNKAIAAFVYISNFDAQELYNIFLNVNPVDKDEFKKLMLNGEYMFHYDNGSGSTESSITSFPCLAHANSLGVFNRARLYLAHITDVNGTYSSVNEYSFDAGTPTDWKAISLHAGYDFLNVFATTPSKKVRVVEYKDDAVALKTFLKAHFFRFIHPFNHYLVPGMSYEVNAVFGKTQKSVGEYRDLTAYVKYRMYTDFIAGDAELEAHYKTFEDAILIDDSEKLSKNFASLETEYRSYEGFALHAIYGTTVGKEGQLLAKAAKKISNTDELFDLYKNYTAGYIFTFYDRAGAKVDVYSPSSLSDYVDLLDKLLSKVTRIGSKDPLQIKLEKASAPAPRKKTTSSRKPTAKAPTAPTSPTKRAGSDLNYKMAAHYMRYGESLSVIGTKFLPTPDPSGSKTKSRFNSIGITVEHKGLLIGSTLDDEIAKASGAIKTVLEEIKKRGF